MFFQRALMLSLLIPIAAGAAEIKVKYLRAYDGDTVHVTLLDLQAFDKAEKYAFFWKDVPVRIAGIDTPEMHGRCAKEILLAKRAKQLVEETLSKAKKVTIDHADRDKYFRILGDIYADGVPISQMLLDGKLAVPYSGGHKAKDWCN